MEVRVGITEGKVSERELRASWLGGDDYLKGGRRQKESGG